MANLLNSNVMMGLMSASSSGKLQQVATDEYYKAKNRGDEGAMERSKGYATDFYDKAMTAIEETEEALAERAKEISAEQRFEREQAEEKDRVESVQSAGNAASTIKADTPVQSAIPREQPAATLELSQEYFDSTQAGATSKAEPATSADNTVQAFVPTKKTAQTPTVEIKLYAKTGKMENVARTRIKLR